MLKLSPLFVALLAGLSSASPAIETRAGPPEAGGNICRPNGLDTTVKFFLQFSGNASFVWQAEEVTSTNFEFIDLVTKTTAAPGTQARNNQLFSIVPVNNGNSFAIVSAGPTSASVCANGDGGPLDSLACPSVFSANEVNQTSQFFITCETCASDNLGATGCQIQSANEGQCVDFLDEESNGEEDNTIKLDDCSSSQPNQFWDIVSGAA